jgi:hypothetical protein
MEEKLRMKYRGKTGRKKKRQENANNANEKQKCATQRRERRYSLA